MAFSGPSMCNICWNHEKRCLLIISSLLKKWHYLDLICSLYLNTITTGICYSNRTLLKKWHFSDLVCSGHVVTITTGFDYNNRSLHKKWNFLDLICSVHVVTITTEFKYSNRSILTKVSFSRPDICSTCCNYDNRNLLVKNVLYSKSGILWT